jgi:hypothetical protein
VDTAIADDVSAPSQKRASTRTPLRSVAVAVLFSSTISIVGMSPASANGQPARRSATIATELSFRGLWWSEAQRDGLNPNAPPPKTTEVTIDKWEYSDPVSVPHPDVVDVVIDVKNVGDVPAQRASINVSRQWLTGPQGDQTRARWTAPRIIKREAPVDLDPGLAHTMRIPVDLASMMKTLGRTLAWPWALRLHVTVRAASGQVLLRTTRDLPILPGD